MSLAPLRLPLSWNEIDDNEFDDNEFDDNAVLVAVNKKKVGYVPSDISHEVTNYLDERGLDGVKVNGRFGWDVNNPSPAIGLRLDFNF